jgi:hypothetical protein
MISVDPVTPPQVAHAAPQRYADFNGVDKWHPFYNTDYNPMFNKKGAFFPCPMSKLSFNPGAAYGIDRGVKRGMSSRAWGINCFNEKQLIRDPLTRPQFPRLQTGAVGKTIRQQAMFEDTIAVGMPNLSPEVII